MAKRQTTETKVANLKALRKDPHSPAALTEFRKALADRSNYVAARAAEMIGELEIRVLAPELVAAFDRLMIDPSKTDPQCLAKTAIAETLVRIEWDDQEFFVKGIHYTQPEPVWGGEQDSAAQLRGACALGLAQSSCGDVIRVLNHLADLLADPEKPARIGAARAIAQCSRLEGMPLLRLKIRSGDEAAEVLGECFAALLSLSAPDAIPLIAGFLQAPDPDLRLEAAACLGESREYQAFAALKTCWENQYDASYKKSLLLSMGLSRQPAAVEFLLSLVGAAPPDIAADAVTALAPCRFHAPTRQKVEATVRQNGHPSLHKTFEKLFAVDRT
jgi:HEAT repeat protein